MGLKNGEIKKKCIFSYFFEIFLPKNLVESRKSTTFATASENDAW